MWRGERAGSARGRMFEHRGGTLERAVSMDARFYSTNREFHGA